MSVFGEEVGVGGKSEGVLERKRVQSRTRSQGVGTSPCLSGFSGGLFRSPRPTLDPTVVGRDVPSLPGKRRHWVVWTTEDGGRCGNLKGFYLRCPVRVIGTITDHVWSDNCYKNEMKKDGRTSTLAP